MTAQSDPRDAMRAARLGRAVTGTEQRSDVPGSTGGSAPTALQRQ